MPLFCKPGTGFPDASPPRNLPAQQPQDDRHFQRTWCASTSSGELESANGFNSPLLPHAAASHFAHGHLLQFASARQWLPASSSGTKNRGIGEPVAGRWRDEAGLPPIEADGCSGRRYGVIVISGGCSSDRVYRECNDAAACAGGGSRGVEQARTSERWRGRYERRGRQRRERGERRGCRQWGGRGRRAGNAARGRLSEARGRDEWRRDGRDDGERDVSRRRSTQTLSRVKASRSRSVAKPSKVSSAWTTPLTFTPRAPLSLLSDHEVALSGAITDEEGSGLSSPPSCLVVFHRRRFLERRAKHRARPEQRARVPGGDRRARQRHRSLASAEPEWLVRRVGEPLRDQGRLGRTGHSRHRRGLHVLPPGGDGFARQRAVAVWHQLVSDAPLFEV